MALSFVLYSFEEKNASSLNISHLTMFLIYSLNGFSCRDLLSHFLSHRKRSMWKKNIVNNEKVWFFLIMKAQGWRSMVAARTFRGISEVISFL